MELLKPILVFIFLGNNISIGQILIHPTLSDSTLELNKQYLFNKDTISFKSLKFYISKICFYNNSKQLSCLKEKHHLLNWDNPSTFLIPYNSINNSKANRIEFYVGVDSTTNVSGAIEGGLDPTNGMYWTWQSGYINFKLEGTHSRSKGRNKTFQYHLGGYQHPYNSIQKITLQTYHDSSIVIELELDRLISSINPTTHHTVMSPSKKSVEISTMLTNLFSISAKK